MFGGNVSPATSPRPRKSASRFRISDLGIGDGSIAEEYILRSVESNDMKGVPAPLTSVAIIPSPILLWRLKVLFFVIWGYICCKVGWGSVMRMSADLRDLFLYETTMVWLWGINLWVFLQANFSYATIFELDQNHLTHREIWKCATWMTIIVPTSMTAYLYLYSHGEVPLAAFQPVLLYAAVAMIMIFPFDIFYLSSRYFFLRTLWRIALPLQVISFPDFFVADILTSMSKVLSDLERSVCRMVHRQVATIAWFDADSVCGSNSVAIPIVLVLPYIFRLFQCLRQYKDTGEKTTLLNGYVHVTIQDEPVLVTLVNLMPIKSGHQFVDLFKAVGIYCFKILNSNTSDFPFSPQVSCLARPVDKHISPFVDFVISYKFLIFFLLGCYQGLGHEWVHSDLEVQQTAFFLTHVLWKEMGKDALVDLIVSKIDLLSLVPFGCIVYTTEVYFWVIGSNLILRCTWTYKLSAHLRHNYLTVFGITALEIFRRFQRVFFRVEKEVIKMNSKQNIQLATMDKSAEDTLLLSDYNV